MTNEDNCPECLCELSEEDFTNVFEDRGHYGCEEITTGFKCHNCGHEERY